MGMYFRDIDGNESLIAGMGRSGELVPSVSYYQTGEVTIPTNVTTNQTSVTFDEAMPDADYIVVLNPQAVDGIMYIQNTGARARTEAGFIVDTSTTSITKVQTIVWQAFKLMTDESRALDESQIEQNTTDIEALLDKNDNNFSTTETEILKSGGSYTVTADVVWVRAVFATTSTQYSGAEFKVNGIKVAALGANVSGSAVTMQQAMKCYKGDVLTKAINSAGGTCNVYILEHK